MWSKLWTRLMNIFKAKANTAIDKMENPVEMYRLAVQEFEIKMKQSETAVAKFKGQVTLRKKELEQFKLESIKRKDQAKEALNKQREDLAKTALEYKAEADKKVLEYTAMVQVLEAQAKGAEQDHDRNVKKLKDSRTKYELYKAKYESAKAKQELASSMSEIGGDSALSNLTRYEQEINKLDAESNALDEMVNKGERFDDELNTITVEAEIVDEMDVLRAEAELDKKKKEQEKIEKISKLAFPKELDAPKQNPLNALPQNTKEKVIQEHFKKESSTDDKQKKIDDFFKDQK